MKYLLLSLLMFFGCSDRYSSTLGPDGNPGKNGSSCSVSKTDNGAFISCADGTSQLVTDGSNGVNGTNGLNGLPGGNCSVSQQPQGALITCPDNSAVLVTNGTDGTNGTNGSNGSNGTNGTNGTVVEPIQFCTGFTQTYPSVFAECGFCINGIMYGVYSANDGFLAELPPGTYSSDGINSSCTFTIGDNCKVSP